MNLLLLRDVAAMLLAGGAGERLYPLTRHRTKPAVSFGGPYRIVDFTLSNCLNSGLRKIFIATQYKAQSLNRHIRMGWSVVNNELGEFVEVLPPPKRRLSLTGTSIAPTVRLAPRAMCTSSIFP